MNSDELNAFLHCIAALLKARSENGTDAPVIAAIDGMCGSGKTTLSERLAQEYGCSVIHMDDFYLPLSLRTPERYAEPGGNVHYERFLEEVVRPLASLGRKKTFSGLKVQQTCPGMEFREEPCCEKQVSGGDSRSQEQRERSAERRAETAFLAFRKFDCMRMDYACEPIRIPVTPLLVIEGTYSMRREFRPLYDVTAFLSCSKEIQKARILKRNGAALWAMFRTKWIPLEQAYFEGLHPEEAAMYRIRMDESPAPAGATAQMCI